MYCLYFVANVATGLTSVRVEKRSSRLTNYHRLIIFLKIVTDLLVLDF